MDDQGNVLEDGGRAAQLQTKNGGRDSADEDSDSDDNDSGHDDDNERKHKVDMGCVGE